MAVLENCPTRLDKLASRRLFPALIFLVALAYLLLGSNRDVNFYDEGLTVYGACRCLDGQVPYRDFWTIYPPGQFYLLALAFKLFGTSLLVGRVLTSAINAMIVLSVYLVARKILPWRYSLFSSFLILVWFAKHPMYTSALNTAILFALLSCLCLLHGLETGLNRWVLLAGLLTGVGTLFRHDIGFYTFVSQSAVTILFTYARCSQIQVTKLKRLFGSLKTYGILFAGVLMVLLPVGAALIAAVGTKELFTDLILFPAAVFPEFRASPYPGPCPNPSLLLSRDMPPGRFIRKTIELVPFYVPVIFLVTAVQLVLTVLKKRSLSFKGWVTLLVLLLGLTFLNYARVRSDLWHMSAALIPAVILLASALHTFSTTKTSKSPNVLRSLTILILVMTSISFGRTFVRITGRKLNISRSTRKLISLDIPRAAGIRLSRDKAEPLAEAVNYVRSVTGPDETIFVGNPRHDRVLASDVMFYFLAARDSATKYYNLHPGLATTEAVQEHIVDDLRAHAVTHIVIVDRWEHYEPLNRANESSGITLLDDFIESNYAEIDAFGPYRILRIKSLRSGL